jgi:hypothetical protein
MDTRWGCGGLQHHIKIIHHIKIRPQDRAWDRGSGWMGR